jgi:hypothetical protein
MTRLFNRTERLCVALVIVVVCGGFAASAQKSARPNLSGTWVMETAGRSYDLREKDFIIERTSPTPSDITLKISDDGSDIKVLRTFVMGAETQEQTLEYHTDGRGETNPALASQRSLATWTRWKGDRLLFRFDQFTASVAGRPIAGYREIEWRVAEGGTKLIETDTTRYQESNLSDSSVSASDMRQPSIVPPAITVRRVYKKLA